MPRRKTAEALPEEDQPKRGRKKLVDAEHTIKYSAPVPVEVEETSDDDLIFEEDAEEVEKKRKRKTARDEREDLRRDMDRIGVAPFNSLKLTIEKYKHSDSTDSGTTADKDYCTRYACTKEHILNGDFLDVARRWGAGRYWLTLRLHNKIVREWDREISAPLSQTGAILQNAIPGDPTSQVVIQTGDGQQVASMPSIRDVMKAQKEAFKEQLEMAKLMREAYGMAPETGQQRSEEEVLTTAILKQPEVIENVVGSVLKRFGGSGGGKDDEPWYADVVRDAVKSGQAVQIVKTAIDGLFQGFGSLIPRRDNNGQAQMGAPALAHQGQNETGRNQSSNDRDQGGMGQAQINETSAPVLSPGETQSETTPEGQMLTPADELIYALIGLMEKQSPIAEAQNVININVVRHPELGDSIDELLNLSVDQILTLLAAYHPPVAQMSHARQWLQSLIDALTSEETEANQE